MINPTQESDLAEVIAGASTPLRVIGGGTRPIGRPIAGEALSVAGLAGISLYEPGALTLVAQAGTPMRALQAALDAEGQMLAFEPMDHRALLGTVGAPTIGGVVAGNVSGPRRVQTGACRDHLLGVRFIDGNGAVVKNGGRVMKNVTGYDLVKLMAGAYGTLGVLTELSFKVLAKPESEASLLLHGQDAGAAVDTLCQALGSPFDVSGAAYFGPGAGADQGRTVVRLEGLSVSVAYRAQRLSEDILAGCEILRDAESAEIWRAVRDVEPFAHPKTTNGAPAAEAAMGAVWRISVKPTDGPSIGAALAEQGVPHQALYDWGGGLIWVQVADAQDAGAAIIRAQVAKLGGHATLIRAREDTRARVPVFQPEAPGLSALSHGLRAKFDPRGILNPGLMG